MKSKFIAMAAAAVASVSAANAADLGHPVAAAVDYVKVCNAYGAGFFYIPGGDTCLKISGRVYFDERVGGGKISRESTTNSPYSTNQARTGNLNFTRTAVYVNFDARTNTDYGLLRSYIDLRVRTSTGSPDAATASVGANGPLNELDMDFGYVQWGGLTAGKARSFFDFAPSGGYTYALDYVVYQTNTLANEIGYTFTLGNGLTATIGLLDSTSADSVYNNLLRNEVTNKTTTGYGGNHTPDVVANLNITQAWGSAQIGAALHEDYSILNGAKEGYALNAGTEILLPTLGKGDKIALMAGYSNGAIGYLTAGAQGTATIGKAFRPGNFIGDDYAIDANGSLKLTNAWGGDVSFKHVFNANFEFNIDAAYLGIDGYGARDFSFYGIASNVVWYPTGKPELSLGLDASYGSLNYTGGTKASYTAGTNPLYGSIQNVNGWELGLRVNRTF
ncbi:MAG: porin [Ancalomicrobiaceae bacterium]|nr:porin [Ancalomicrobiaceae bacterium]